MAHKRFKMIFKGKAIDTIEELQRDFSSNDILGYYRNHLLEKWLKERNLNSELNKVKAIKADDDKKAMTKKEMSLPDDAEISFADNKVIVKSTLSAAELTEMQEDYKLSSIPSDAKIKTIKDNEYEITMSTKEWETIVFHVNKD